MPQTMIDRIRETEARTDQIKAEAVAKARDRIRATEEELTSWKEEQYKLIRQQMRRTLEEAEAAAAQRALREQESARTDGEALRRQAAGQMDSAVALIVERIVG